MSPTSGLLISSKGKIILGNDKIKYHIDELRKKHHNIQLEINKMIHTHQSDKKIAELKKEKLRIKDEIENCERQLRN